MGTSSETREDARAGSAIEGAARLAAASPSWPGAARERSPFPALPDGWSVIGRCRSGTAVPGPHATGCYALAHPKVGVALIDIVPDATPNAEARLRRALAAAEFWPDFPGTLPVAHNRLDAAALRSLPWVLERWFAALPALTVPGGSAWIEGVRRAMAVDPAWELPGQPKTAPDAPSAAADGAAGDAAPAQRPPSRAERRRGGLGKLATMPLAFASVFALGLVSGFVLLESSKPGDRSAPTTAAQPQSAAVPQEAAPTAAEVAAAAPRSSAAAPAEAPKPATTDASAASRSEPAAPVSAPAAPSPAAARAEPAPSAAPSTTAAAPSPAAPEGPAAMEKVAGLALDAGAGPQAGSSLETRVSHAVPIGEALPMAPPRAPAAPPVRASASQASSRPVPVVDRACSQALFRFQQGERLTAAEQNFVRTGCSTARR